MAEQHQWKVGDEIALDYGKDGLSRYIIARVERITPSGRLVVLGKRQINPKRMVVIASYRGEWGAGITCQPVTDEIRESIRRERHLSNLKRAAWHNMPTETLDAVVATLERCSREKTAGVKREEE